MAGSVDKLLLSARRHAKRGEVAPARALYMQVLERFPGNKRAQDGLAALQSPAATARRAPPRALLDQLMGLMQAGRHRDLAEAAGRALAMFPDTTVLLEFRAAGLSGLGDHAGAAQIYRHLITLRPDHANTHGNLGNALMELGDHDGAAAQFSRVLALRPGDPVALNNLGNAETARGRTDAARACYEAAVTAAPGNADAQNNLGNLLRGQGDMSAAQARLSDALALDPRHVFALNNLGIVLLTQGDTKGALARFEAAIAADPGYAEAHWNRAGLHRFTQDDPAIAQMQAILTEPDRPEHDRMLLEFALGKAMDDIGDTARAFDYWRAANARRKAELGYDIAQDRALFANLHARFAVPHPPIPDDAAPGPEPIFILGLPRSGTTLVEQIVTQHSAVAAGGEIATLDAALSALDWSDPQALSRAAPQIRADYRATLSGLAQGAEFVTDKMPLNFRWIGAIRVLFPTARIVHVQRDPRAVLWSIYRYFFSSTGNGYAHDLDDLVAYHGLYRDLMARWTAQPGPLCEIDYEALTEAPEARTRALIDALGLPWEDACLRPQDNARSVATTSTTQVRRAIYKGSSQDWHRYESLLDGAFDGLTR